MAIRQAAGILSAAFCLPADPTAPSTPSAERKGKRNVRLSNSFTRRIARGLSFSPGRRGRTYNRCLKIRPDKGDRTPYARLRRLEEAPYAHVSIEQRAARVECSALSRSKSYPLRPERLIPLPALRHRDGLWKESRRLHLRR